MLVEDWWRKKSVQLAGEEEVRVEVLTEVEKGWWSRAGKSTLQTGYGYSEVQHMKGATAGCMCAFGGVV